MSTNYALQYDFTDETLAIDDSQTVPHWHQAEPEKYLLLAVLKDAILTLPAALRVSRGDL
jgi:hypothetical protein